MAYNAGSRQDIRKAQKAAKVAEDNRGVILKVLASSMEGRRYLWEELASSHLFQTIYDDSHSRMAYLEGQRSSGLRLFDDLVRQAPDQLLQMIREANERNTIAESTGSSNGRWDDQGRVADDEPDFFGDGGDPAEADGARANGAEA